MAPPTILFALDRIVSGYVGGLPGIHAMYAGTDFRWERPIGQDDRVVGDSVLHALIEKPSKFAKRAIQQIYRTTFTNQRGERGVRGGLVVLPDRARDRARARQVQVRGPAPLLRGRDRRHPSVLRDGRDPGRDAAALGRRDGGEALPVVVKGPLTVTSVVAFVQGWGSLYVRAHGLAFDLFDRHPALGIPNDFGVPEPPERVHWDEALARAVGVPGPYDYGPSAWPGSATWSTNWMGDAGFLRRLSVKVLRHNLIGDTTWCRGRVTGKGAGGVVTPGDGRDQSAG